jgi:hypothetical protein
MKQVSMKSTNSAFSTLEDVHIQKHGCFYVRVTSEANTVFANKIFFTRISSKFNELAQHQVILLTIPTVCLNIAIHDRRVKTHLKHLLIAGVFVSLASISNIRLKVKC